MTNPSSKGLAFGPSLWLNFRRVVAFSLFLFLLSACQLSSAPFSTPTSPTQTSLKPSIQNKTEPIFSFSLPTADQPFPSRTEVKKTNSSPRTTLRPWAPDPQSIHFSPSGLQSVGDPSVRAFGEKVLELLQKHSIPNDHLSFIYREPESTGSALFYRPDEIQTAASTIKLPLALITLDALAEGKLSLSMPVTQESRDWEGGSGHLQFQKAGNTYPLQNLLRWMIVESDNVATNMIRRLLLERVSPRALDEMRARFSLPQFSDRNRATARGMIDALHLWRENPQNNPLYARLGEWLEESEVTFIGTQFPPDLKYAHKYGLYADTCCEIAWVPANHPFYAAIYVATGTSEKARRQAQNFLSDWGQLCLQYANR